MRATLIFFLCLFKIIDAQDYKENFKDDICNCLGQYFNEKGVFQNAYTNCFAKELPKYANIIDSEIDEENPKTKYRKGQTARNELKKKFVAELVFSCDLYFNTINNEREKTFERAKSKVSKARLTNLNEQVAMTPNSWSYSNRAETHFYLGNLVEAEKDIKKAIEIHKHQQQNFYYQKNLLLLGWILEKRHNLKDAYSVYNSLHKINYDTQTSVLRAIVKRKLDGNIPEIDNKKTLSKELNIFKNKDGKKVRPTVSDKKKASKDDLRSLFKIDKNNKNNN